MRVIYESNAYQEGIDAATWYEEQQDELGKRFLTEWKRTENRMAANPEIHRCFEGEWRSCRFEVFPYTLIFRVCGDDLQVLAVMHMSRRPGYWKQRG